MQQALDLYVAYKFVKQLTTPFDQWEAYKLGIIDAEGNVIKERADLTTQERNAFGYFDILILNLKHLLEKFPGGSSKFGTYAAALFLLKTYPKIKEEDETLFDDLEKHIEEAYSKLHEDGVPVNSAGGGGIEGIGVGPKGEPGFSKPIQNKYKESNKKGANAAVSAMKLLRRTSPNA